ncbi:hypothetical protein MD484_g7895, partial [Candolleomyces efflorescens]
MSVNEEQYVECMRRKSTILALIPFRTNSLFGGGLLASELCSDHAFTKLSGTLDAMDFELQAPSKRWSGAFRLHGSGIFQLYDLVVDNQDQGFSPKRLSLGVQATVATLSDEGGGRLPRPAAELLGGYICAHKFFDTLVWLSGQKDRQVLQHRKRSSWRELAVKSKIWDHIANLPALLNSFRQQAKSLEKLQRSSKTLLSANGSASEVNAESLEAVALRIIDDSITSVTSSKASKVLTNFAVMALNLAFMRMGYLEVPDNVLELEKSLAPVVISKESVSLEDLIIISKELGNQYPAVLDKIERDVWHEIFRQACGLQTSVESFLRLSETWKERDWEQELLDAADYYKKPDAPPLLDHPLKLFEGDVVGEVPDAWPISDLTRKFMWRQTRKQSPANALDAVATLDDSCHDNVVAPSAPSAPIAIQTIAPADSVSTAVEQLADMSCGNNTPNASSSPTILSNDQTSSVTPLSSPLNSTNLHQPLPPIITALTNLTSPSMDADSPLTHIGSRSISPNPLSLPLSPIASLSARSTPSPPSPKIPEHGVSSESHKAEERHRYPKRARNRHTVNVPEAPHRDDSGKMRPPKAKRQKVFHSPGIVDIRGVVERLSHEEGRQELDEKIRVKQEELETEPDVAIPSLRIDQPAAKYTDSLPSPFIARLYDCDGKGYHWPTFFHSKSDFKAFEQFYEQLEADYVSDGDGADSQKRPRFLAQPESSIFFIVSRKEFNRMPTQVVQKLLRDRCIVITEEERPEIRFDIAGIEEILGSIHKPTEIQDQSIAPRAGNFQHRITIGTPEDLYKASIADHPMKKSLNALYFPNPNAGIEMTAFSSEARAFMQTAGEPFCTSLVMPVADLRFSLGATEGAHHYWHIDSDGLGTIIMVACGLKLWAVARELNPNDFASIAFWANPKLDVTKTRNIHATEAIVLNCKHTLYEFLDTRSGERADPYLDIFAPLVAWIIIASQHYYRLVYSRPESTTTRHGQQFGFVPLQDVFEKQIEWSQSNPCVAAAILELKSKEITPESLWPDWTFEATSRNNITIVHEVPNPQVLSLNGVRNGDRLYFSIFEPDSQTAK